MATLTTTINKLLNHEFNKTTISSIPNTYYINLSTTSIEDNGSGYTYLTNGEGNYATVSLNRNENNWTESFEGEITNSVLVSFPSGSMVSSTDWGTIMAVAISASSDGAPIYFYNLAPYIEAPVGTRITFEGGSLKFGRRNQTGE